MPLSLPTPLNSERKSRAFLCYLCAVVHKSILAKIKTVDLICRLVDVLPISYCCHASPEAVSVSSPLQTYCIKTLVLEAVAFIYRGCCFITITIATITQEETVFAHSSLAQKLLVSGLFPFPRTCSDLVLGFFRHCSFGVSFLFTHLHTSLHKPVALCLSMPCNCFCFEICWP